LFPLFELHQSGRLICVVTAAGVRLQLVGGATTSTEHRNIAAITGLRAAAAEMLLSNQLTIGRTLCGLPVS
jgi:hypothetical protein